MAVSEVSGNVRRRFDEMRTLWVLFAVYVSVESQVNPQQFCERYVECAAVATLEERLCLGNSLLRPYWLPQAKDKYNCHETLKNDYKMLEKMEEDLDKKLSSCLLQFTVATSAVEERCNSAVLRSSPRFSFGRTINYVPTHCFLGRQNRINRECAAVRNCCPATNQCSSVSSSSEAKRIEAFRIKLRERAKDCAKGLPVAKLPLPQGYDAEDSSNSAAPVGNVNVRFTQGSGDDKKSTGEYEWECEVFSGESGSVNVRIRTEESGYGDDIGGSAGEISKPIPEDDKYLKVHFSRESQRNQQNRAELTDDNGSLTLATQPRLAFPDDKMAIATKEGVVVVNIHPENSTARRKPDHVISKQSHEKAFQHALKNTNEYKEKISKINSAEAAREGLESLLKAGQVSAKSAPVPSKAAEKPSLKASGAVRSLEMIGDDDDPRNGEFVTTAPVIFVDKKASARAMNRSGACMEQAMKAQTEKLQHILTMLGEKSDSDDMHEIKELIDQWHNQFRRKVVTAKEKTTKIEISRALEDLIQQFDRVNLQLIKSQINATFDEGDYPEEDAKVFESQCDPLLVNHIMEGNLGREPQPDQSGPSKHKFDRGNVTFSSNTDGERTVVEDGVEKVILAGGDVVGMSIDNDVRSIGKGGSGDAGDSDKEIIHNWTNEEYKRELEKYRKEHRINSPTDGRNETSCDIYMRCRNQMHLAVDSCAWRFANAKILPSLAESAESLLYKAEDLCDPDDQPLYEDLYEKMIRRNSLLRSCLDEKNEKFFSSSLCIPYSSVEHLIYSSAFMRLLSEDYKHSSQCYNDANLIQQKCTKLRECCPNFDSCRQETIDVNLEQAIISTTARINEGKHNCLKKKAREAFKLTLRGLLGRAGRTVRDTLDSFKQGGQLRRNVIRGAQVLARFR
ncbi:hypothetical protein Q1695_011990 [Nippostrongylus brasiliensis]|nr:hypothetical protein Q1695_011990 [Nippostrongylus brasiliensis]